MHTEIHLHGKTIRSVFELLGHRENDVTFSLGWAFAQSDRFRVAFLRSVFPSINDSDSHTVLLQDRHDCGITDIEIKNATTHVIIEAKRGIQLPGQVQLRRYAKILDRSPVTNRAIVTVSAASHRYATTRLGPHVASFACVHRSLEQIDTIARACRGTHAERRLLHQLSVYLRSIARMQDKHSNLVYVVTLSNRTPARSTTSWRDVVTVHNLYFHPVGSNYPREPVNYIGFRFDGQLRSIRHVEHVEVVSSLTGRIPGFSYTLNGPHYLYTLGKPIMPSHKVTNGTVVRANRVYAAIDLLLTCSTISEAGRKTRLRLEGTKDQLTSRPGVPSNTHKKTRVAKSLAKVNAKYGKALKRLAK